MRATFFIGAAASILGLLAVGAAQAEVLRAGGTGTATALMQSLGVAYAAGADDRIVVVPSLGTKGAIRAVIDGKLDIAVSARPLTPEEQAAGLVTLGAIKTPFGFVSSRKNPPGLRKGDIVVMFNSERAPWPDGYPLRLVLRPRSESDNALAGAFFPGMREAIEHARARSDVPIAATDQDNADLAERLEGSLTGATLTQIRMETRPLSFVEVDGVKPTLENLETGAYPYAKTLYLVALKSRRTDLQSFDAFLRSTKGREAQRDRGVLPAPTP
jgi:phosphate transport system substrate-binding protein